jgi:RNA polymerase sigma factor (sigma-70 family)
MEAHALGSVPMERARLGPLRRLAGDERLVAAVRAGREDAFEAIFDRYHRQLLSFCRHMVGSREEAEDAVQATFLSAYRDMVGSDKPLQLRPWLYTIARNHCVSMLRARRESASLEDVEASVDGLAAEVQRREDLRWMLHDLARLPDDQRAALVLSEMGALSHDEIAGVLACPRKKVKALVFQARTSLAASRAARETPCVEVREQLATLSGGTLRRGNLRRHLRDCDGCREFQAEVKRQRAALAVLLPVVPSAGLKTGVLGGVHAGATAAALGTGGGAAGGGLGALLGGGAAKLLVAAAVVAGAAGGGVVAVDAIEDGGGAGHHATSPVGAPAATTGPGSHASSAATGDVPAGFDPARVRGEIGLGKQGHVGGLKGLRGNSAFAPGRTHTNPGLTHTHPDRSGATEGRAGTSPGRAGTTPHSNSSQTGSRPSVDASVDSASSDTTRSKAGKPATGDALPPTNVTTTGSDVSGTVLGQ